MPRPRLPPRELLSDHLRLLLLPRRLSSSGERATPAEGSGGVSNAAEEAEARKEAYRQIQNLDFMTAAKILFTVPPKRKKFGFDFHLVQFFFACMPSLAVYLVAQYSRYEMRKMEAELEQKKKKAEEEEKAKRTELESVQEDPDTKLSKVIVRLDALEEAVKEIVVEKKKIPPSKAKGDGIHNKDLDTPADDSSDPKSKLKAAELVTSKSKESDVVSDPSTRATIEESMKGQARKAENADGASSDVKK